MAARILILGSKPTCTVPDAEFDVCYPANGAVMRAGPYMARAGRGAGRIVNVVSRDYAMKNHQKAADDLAKMPAYPCDGYIIVGAFQIQPFAPEFRALAAGKPVEKKTTWRRTRDVIRAIGWREARAIADARGGLLALSWRLALKHELNIWKPSAGFYALLIAMERHGPEAEYHVSGVGLSQDGLWNRTGWKNRSHLQIDGLIHALLAPKPNVFFHDVDPAPAPAAGGA